jgi:hypothetical protein
VSLCAPPAPPPAVSAARTALSVRAFRSSRRPRSHTGAACGTCTAAGLAGTTSPGVAASLGLAGVPKLVSVPFAAVGVSVLVIDDRLLGDGGHVLDGLGPVPAELRVLVLGVDDDAAFAARARRLRAEAWSAKERADDQLPTLLAR